jgi:hypothetical protein
MTVSNEPLELCVQSMIEICLEHIIYEILFVKSAILNMVVMQNFEVISGKFNSTKFVLTLCFQYYVFYGTI